MTLWHYTFLLLIFLKKKKKKKGSKYTFKVFFYSLSNFLFLFLDFVWITIQAFWHYVKSHKPIKYKIQKLSSFSYIIIFFWVEIFLLNYYSEELSSFHITLALIMQNLYNIFFRFCHFWSHRNVTITNPPATTTFILHFRSYSIPFLFKNVQ